MSGGGGTAELRISTRLYEREQLSKVMKSCSPGVGGACPAIGGRS